MFKSWLVIILIAFFSLPSLAADFVADIDMLDFCPSVQSTECVVCQKPTPVNSTQELEKFSQSILNTLGHVENDLEMKQVCEAMNVIVAANNNQPIGPIEIPQVDGQGNTWNFRIYFGYTRSRYFNSPEVALNSSRVNVVVKDFEWKERNSFEYFTWDKIKQPGNTFRFIDEPTNSFGFSMEKKNNVIFLSVFHMKWLFNNSQVKHVSGTLDGVEVDKVMPVNEPFDGYNAQPGEMNLIRLENTYWNINPQIGYGRKIDIISNKKFGTLSYTPSVQAGLMIGSSYSAYTVKGGYWDAEDKKQGIEYKGTSLTAGHRLDYEKGRMGLFIDQKYTTSNIKQDFLDGSAKYRLDFSPVTFGLSVKINRPTK
jgi:hypothetical protein